MMGPFCPEQGTSSHAILKDLASTDEKTMFSGEEVGSEKEISEWSYIIHNKPEDIVIHKTVFYLFCTKPKMWVLSHHAVYCKCFSQDKY